MTVDDERMVDESWRIVKMVHPKVEVEKGLMPSKTEKSGKGSGLQLSFAATFFSA